VSEPNRNRKKQDPAWLALKRCVLALEACPPEMVRAKPGVADCGMSEPTKDADRAAAARWIRENAPMLCFEDGSIGEGDLDSLEALLAQAREEGRIAGEKAMRERAAEAVYPTCARALRGER